MLVLKRKVNQSIKIANDIEITILAIEGEQIKIGIEAPKNIEIHRKEVYVAIQNENNEAGDASVDFIKNLTNQLGKNN
ncbi:carbon storage regulator [Niallia circulans]|jgi:carbon storage regulator|uniref:carbon storage regulator CsrA n=1 Tax=Niallia TaxID=2837506 RepID=UPI00077CD841|nr:carbon storage regulator CsrA [Niallia circulans]MDR4316317.1 carbon storage regulator CsrA [Niallia circulans]MED3838513.1 carbon storage regulator CsrA [Niallia circulans]MED4243986.1 carbon storage regulator CsrA [Niallia circulans]MED4246380.1 carbon storage regulator CsrA [Niallia circulans]NRG33210.1 carbon storage regulator CsrA [Niallia circulans]